MAVENVLGIFILLCISQTHSRLDFRYGTEKDLPQLTSTFSDVKGEWSAVDLNNDYRRREMEILAKSSIKQITQDNRYDDPIYTIVRVAAASQVKKIDSMFVDEIFYISARICGDQYNYDEELACKVQETGCEYCMFKDDGTQPICYVRSRLDPFLGLKDTVVYYDCVTPVRDVDRSGDVIDVSQGIPGSI